MWFTYFHSHVDGFFDFARESFFIQGRVRTVFVIYLAGFVDGDNFLIVRKKKLTVHNSNVFIQGRIMAMIMLTATMFSSCLHSRKFVTLKTLKLNSFCLQPQLKPFIVL